MEIFREKEKYEMNDNIEKSSIGEAVPPIKLVEQATDTIAALIHQANIISEENNSMAKSFAYEDINDPKDYISIAEEKGESARGKYNQLRGMKESRFYTVGRNKAKVEKTQDVLVDIIDALDNNANAAKALFNNQIELAKFSKKLYGIGLMGITSNRMVVREIKLRLEKASKEELSELARRELEFTVRELEKQQELEKKFDNIQNAINEKLEVVNNAIINNKKHHDTEINDVSELVSQLGKHVDENQKVFNEKLEVVNNAIINNEKHHDTEINDVSELVSQLGKHVDENLNAIRLITDSYDMRLGTLEEKSFIDSPIYKLLVGIAALGALILSVLNSLA